MEEVTGSFVKALGYRGVFDCGYRYDPRDGHYKMLDVNPRMGSNFRQCVGADGMDVVQAMYLDLAGHPLPREEPAEGRVWWVENRDMCSDSSAAGRGRLAAQLGAVAAAHRRDRVVRS